MKKLTTLLAAIIITMTATSRDFLGVQFGMSYTLAELMLQQSGYEPIDNDGNLVVVGKIKFAGITFDAASFEFNPKMCTARLVYSGSDYYKVFEQTVARLDHKYGKADPIHNDNGLIYAYLDGTTQILCMSIRPGIGRKGSVGLTYIDTSAADLDL